MSSYKVIPAADRTIKVTQVKSGIGAKPKTRGTLRALGLGRIGKTNILPDRPEIRGMLHRVPHLVTVTDLAAETASTGTNTKDND
ncbi:MAG TPA: 50S ribosomal protein L30 [Ilumatobacter sp.]|nr:50S ribosomal protein L30 [Ilumatobacter sp.]